MTFLNPAVLFGLLAASLPVLIHLFNLRKVRNVEFSTLKFLKELQRQKIRKIKIKQWILLALRVLGILLLVFAFARPALQGTTLTGAGSTVKTTAVILIDDSFSMQALNAKGSNFNRAKDLATQIVKNLNEGDEAVLIPFSLREDQKAFTTVSPSEMLKKINELQISSVSTTMHTTVLKAAAVLASSNNFNKEIYLLSDFQKNRLWEEDVNTDLSRGLDERTKIYLIPVSSDPPDNISIDSLLLRSSILQKNKTVYLSAFITNHTDAKKAVVVSLSINGERVAQNSITLQPGETAEAGLESMLKSSGIQEIFASLEDDDILEDNRRYLGALVPEKLKIGLFADDPNELQPAELALQAGDFTGSFIIEKKQTAQISAVNLNDYNVIFICGSGFSVQRVNEYLSRGGGVFLFPSSKSSVPSFSPILTELGAGIISETRYGLSEPQKFYNADLQHPLFFGLFADKSKSDIRSPLLTSYLRTETGASGRAIISLLDGSPFLSEFRKEGGKLLLLSATPTSFSGDLPYTPVFALLMYRSALYLGTKEDRRNAVLAGYALTLPIPPGKPISVIQPGNREESVPENSLRQLYYTGTEKPGLYKFAASGEIFDIAAVNINAKESVAQYEKVNTIQNYFSSVLAKGPVTVLPADENINKGITEARYGAELWRYFILFALLVFVAEMLIARNTRKELDALKTI